MGAGGERHSGDCPHGNLADGRCKDCQIDGLRTANALLLRGMESQAELMDGAKQAVRRLRAALEQCDMVMDTAAILGLPQDLPDVYRNSWAAAHAAARAALEG